MRTAVTYGIQFLGVVAMRAPEGVGSRRSWRAGVDGPLALSSLSGSKVEGNRVGSSRNVVAKDTDFCFKTTLSVVPKCASVLASIGRGGHWQ